MNCLSKYLNLLFLIINIVITETFIKHLVYVLTKVDYMNEDKPEDVITLPKLKLKNDYIIPDILKSWENKQSITPEYRAMMDNLNVLIDNIAVSLNEGPEVADSVAKRIQSFDAIIKSLMSKVFISLYDRIAILGKVQFELMYDNEMKKAAAQYIAAMQEEQKKSDSYVQ